MNHIPSFKDFLYESNTDKLDRLPRGAMFNDAKNIKSVFRVSSHGWSETAEAFEKNQDRGKLSLVNTNDIEITQPNVQSNKVKGLIPYLDEAPEINVVEFPDGKKVIFDGHHRLVANWVLGKKKIKVNLVKTQ